MSLRTLIELSAGSSVPGSHYTWRSSPSSEACWILEKWRTRYFPVISFLISKWARCPWGQHLTRRVDVSYQRHMTRHLTSGVNFTAQAAFHQFLPRAKRVTDQLATKTLSRSHCPIGTPLLSPGPHRPRLTIQLKTRPTSQLKTKSDHLTKDDAPQS